MSEPFLITYLCIHTVFSLLKCKVRVPLKQSGHSLFFVKCRDPQFIQHIVCFTLDYHSTFDGYHVIEVTIPVLDL